MQNLTPMPNENESSKSFFITFEGRVHEFTININNNSIVFDFPNALSEKGESYIHNLMRFYEIFALALRSILENSESIPFSTIKVSKTTTILLRPQEDEEKNIIGYLVLAPIQFGLDKVDLKLIIYPAQFTASLELVTRRESIVKSKEIEYSYSINATLLNSYLQYILVLIERLKRDLFIQLTS